MKIIAALHKSGLVAHTSHLDVQRSLQRAFRRAKVPLAYSQGFNPHPLLSFATALATGYTSDCEWFELSLERDMAVSEFEQRVNGCMPQGMWVSAAFDSTFEAVSLTKMLRAARYEATVHLDCGIDFDMVERALKETLEQKEIEILKKTKGGIKPVNIRPQIITAAVEKVEKTVVRFDILSELNAAGGLRVEPFIHVVFKGFGTEPLVSVHRAAMYFDGCERLPRLP
ncbi:MAG: TIGR03936 family radical SAM-associated protein [Clostridia bacterium]|nr:TIGR03936 family radical SAM-associated protein [Clostridia bacterium]